MWRAYRVFHNLPEDALWKPIDAYIVGYGINVPLVWMVPPWLQAALMFVQLSGGIEFLFPRSSGWELWVYGYFGPGVTFEPLQFFSPSGDPSAGAYIGAAWNLSDATGVPNATAYQGPFICTSLTGKIRLPRDWTPFQGSTQLCSSRTSDGKLGSYSFTGNTSASSWSMSASVLWYLPPIVVSTSQGVTVFQGGFPLADNARALLQSLFG